MDAAWNGVYSRTQLWAVGGGDPTCAQTGREKKKIFKDDLHPRWIPGKEGVDTLPNIQESAWGRGQGCSIQYYPFSHDTLNGDVFKFPRNQNRKKQKS